MRSHAGFLQSYSQAVPSQNHLHNFANPLKITDILPQQMWHHAHTEPHPNPGGVKLATGEPEPGGCLLGGLSRVPGEWWVSSKILGSSKTLAATAKVPSCRATSSWVFSLQLYRFNPCMCNSLHTPFGFITAVIVEIKFQPAGPITVTSVAEESIL
jgi:hypothetical protein